LAAIAIQHLLNRSDLPGRRRLDIAGARNVSCVEFGPRTRVQNGGATVSQDAPELLGADIRRLLICLCERSVMNAWSVSIRIARHQDQRRGDQSGPTN
jgi:hypothetical protein